MSRFPLQMLAAALAAALSACTTPRPGEAPAEAPPVHKVPVSAADGAWELVTSSFIGAGRIPGVPRARLVFDDGRVSVFSGCNNGSAPAWHVEGRLEIGALAATRRACPEPLGTFESRYFRLLKARPVYRAEGGSLVLVDGEQSARFRRVPAGGETAPKP